ncbi:hypothetical protein LAZ67_17002440 [Cordylochernes scorpioides]|uniref:Reverse transcriptase domain-containing protein n=1 Tax=Cordylochernes scorpioides TaxID=51811 RepID=A0ABY6LG42_9ARAC|nr:hypothetical protein LAZ67_17002440 [Cordylochernes scorpioides]
MPSPPVPPAPSEEAPSNAPVTPAAAPGAPALHTARPLLPGEAPSSTCSASNPPTPALPSPAPIEPMEDCYVRAGRSPLTKEARHQWLHLQAPSSGPAPAPIRDIIGFTIASINAAIDATRRKSLGLCHLLRQHRVDIALVQETSARRQGCAVNAALFSIATGPLLPRLETILGVGNVIAYADDIVLLIHRDENFARAAAILESFQRVSGIPVNYPKSADLWCGAWCDRGDSSSVPPG